MKKGTRPARNRRKTARLRAKKKARVQRKRLKAPNIRRKRSHKN